MRAAISRRNNNVVGVSACGPVWDTLLLNGNYYTHTVFRGVEGGGVVVMVVVAGCLVKCTFYHFRTKMRKCLGMLHKKSSANHYGYLLKCAFYQFNTKMRIFGHAARKVVGKSLQLPQTRHDPWIMLNVYAGLIRFLKAIHYCWLTLYHWKIWGANGEIGYICVLKRFIYWQTF